MGNFLIKLAILALSSLIVSALLYYRVKILHLQQIILLMVAVLVIALRFLRHSVGKKVVTGWVLIFIITFFVQLLIAATGAVFSPFFILIHLHVIGLALFFDFWTAFSFLAMELVVLFLNISFDKNLFVLVNQDIGSVLLYFSSIVVITPISKFISQQYHIKSDTLKLLFKELSTTESIIEQIDDFVLTTDKNLILLSANDAAFKIIDLPKNDSQLTDLLNLVDAKGKRLTKETLLRSLSSLTQTNPSSDSNRLNLTIKGYSLKIPNKRISPKVLIRVSPVLSQDGRVEKFIFLIGQIEDGDQKAADSKLQAAHLKYLSVLNILSSDPIISKLTVISLYLDILEKYEKDILIASEFNLYPQALKIKLADTLKIASQVQKQHQKLAQKLGIEYRLNIPDNLQEEFRLAAANSALPEYLTEPSSLSVTTDAKLLQILMEKILEIVTSIAYANKEGLLHGKTALVEVEITPSDNYITLSFKTKINSKSKEGMQKFLNLSSDNLEIIDNLALSSSLESYIIKNIINLLGISFKTEYNQYSSELSFNIAVNKSFNRTR